MYDAVRSDGSGALPTIYVRVKVGGLTFAAQRTIPLDFLADVSNAASLFVRQIIYPEVEKLKQQTIDEVVKKTCQAIKNTCAGALGITYCLGDVPGISNLCP